MAREIPPPDDEIDHADRQNPHRTGKPFPPDVGNQGLPPDDIDSADATRQRKKKH